MKTLRRMLLVTLLAAPAAPALAQTPNTSAIVVAVVDQTGGVVADATVTVLNTETGASRDVPSDAQGLAGLSALPLTGTYTIKVSKTGFTAEDVTGLVLRAGETATVRVKLVAS